MWCAQVKRWVSTSTGVRAPFFRWCLTATARNTTFLRENTFSVGKKKLRQVSCVERWCYLGVDFDSSGSATIDNISKAPLKPQQRLEIVRGHLVPKVSCAWDDIGQQTQTARCSDPGRGEKVDEVTG